MTKVFVEQPLALPGLLKMVILRLYLSNMLILFSFIHNVHNFFTNHCSAACYKEFVWKSWKVRLIARYLRSNYSNLVTFIILNCCQAIVSWCKTQYCDHYFRTLLSTQSLLFVVQRNLEILRWLSPNSVQPGPALQTLKWKKKKYLYI